ncbi:SGNH/GDSL hydrolase family protein [Vibrio sp.]|uniref:SGNH/GDSL hydrolase family protein n=1 Tax=Vibrio sp. TaxID=678 RepID=UPI00311EED49
MKWSLVILSHFFVACFTMPVPYAGSHDSESASLDEQGIELIDVEDIDFEQQNEASSEAYKTTTTYVRCWYRASDSLEKPKTKWKWALDDKGKYFRLEGYWWSSYSPKNMFYTNTTQEEIREVCENTLEDKVRGYEHADIRFYASDHRGSYNHTIWTNDKKINSASFNRIVAFGDSISETGNIYNASQWLFPNSNSWFGGNFSNGFVWTEYLAANMGIPLYNWAIGGAAGSDQYKELKGVSSQVDSYVSYMKKAKNYDPEYTLFTLEFGLNDLMNYRRDVYKIKADLSRALTKLTENGAKNILMLRLPDVSNAPLFKKAPDERKMQLAKDIGELNEFFIQHTGHYLADRVNVMLFAADEVMNDLLKNPTNYGFENSSDACLDLKGDSPTGYFFNHKLTKDCMEKGSDKYVFWDVTHPTTAVHEFLAKEVLDRYQLIQN